MSQPQPSEEWATFRAKIIAATTRPARKPNAPRPKARKINTTKKGRSAKRPLTH